MDLQQDKIIQALQRLGIAELNAMQQAALEAGTARDLVLLSPTGSGKTLAFLLPLLPELEDAGRVQVLVVVPSRELALQIDRVFRAMGTGLKATCCYGGHPFQTEKRSLEQPPAVLIGTPGRLLDHLERGDMDLRGVHTVILDEFDKSLELKFVPEMKRILAQMPGVRRRVLTSATAAIEVPEFVGLCHPLELSFLEDKPRGLKLFQVHSPEIDKLETLYTLLGELQGEPALVFCNYRESVDRVGDYLQQKKVEAVCFHGGLEQPEREQRLARLANGSTAVFITTDLAARGLDIPEVRHIIHYHLPLNEEAFVHRNGRTARMHATGTAYLLLNPIEEVPAYVPADVPEFFLPGETRVPKPAAWETLHINKGKRDKVSRGDIVGFLCQKGGLKPEEVGRIDVFESCALVAVRRGLKKNLLARIRNEKIKNKQAKYS